MRQFTVRSWPIADDESEPPESAPDLPPDDGPSELRASALAHHDRLPVILGRDDYAAWLDPDTKDAERLKAVLQPPDPEDLTLHPVSRLVNSPRNDRRELVEPVAA